MALDQPVSAVARAGATVERVLGDAATAAAPFQRVAVAAAAQYVRVGVVFAQAAGALGAEEGASAIGLWGLVVMVVVSVRAVLFAVPERRHAVKKKVTDLMKIWMHSRNKRY